MMTYTIKSQSGRKVKVVLNLGNGQTITKNMQLEPVAYDIPDLERGGTKLAFKDPFDDLDTFFKEHMEAYLRGNEEQTVPLLALNQAIDPVAAIAAKEALADEDPI